MMTFENIILESENRIATITINRPKQLNALNKQTIEDLHKALSWCQDSANIRAIILTGSGEKAFVAGADIKEFADFSVDEGKYLSKVGHDLLFNFLEDLSIPVIAAINGFALGGGLELAMSSHIRIASDKARMGLPEVSLGVIPGYGGTQRLAQLVGRGKAMEMITTAGMINAAEALQWGLVNHVVTPEDLITKAREIAEKICANSGTAIASAIKSVNANFDVNINGFDVEIEEFGLCFGTDEFKEGTTAFLEKRKPNFK
jgi:enoyl-CoA hydratase